MTWLSAQWLQVRVILRAAALKGNDMIELEIVGDSTACGAAVFVLPEDSFTRRDQPAFPDPVGIPASIGSMSVATRARTDKSSAAWMPTRPKRKLRHVIVDRAIQDKSAASLRRASPRFHTRSVSL